MSTSASDYAQFILKAHFGPVATSVTKLMRIKGPVLLLEILRDCPTLHSLHITRCLRSLMRHMVVHVTKTKTLKYELNYPLIYCLPRFPFFCQLVLHFYGKIAEEIISNLFLLGRATASDIIGCCFIRHHSSSDADRHKFADSLAASFDTLVKTGVLRVVPSHTDASQAGTVSPNHGNETVQEDWRMTKDEFCESLHRFVSTGSKRWIGSEDTDEPEEKRARDKNTPNPAWKLAIAPNIAVLEAMWRDRLIFHLAEERLGETCADLLSRFLCMATAARRNTEITSHASGAVSRNELLRILPGEPESFDSNLTLLTEDEVEFLVQEPGIGGYMYKCPYKSVVRHMLTKHAEHVVHVLFQHNGLRIFRLLLTGPLNHEELERRVLLPQKDFRRTLPRMIAAGFIYTTELSRSKEYTSETILCLYSVNLSQVASLLIELAQHTALRVALRAEHEFEQKTRLIEQRYRIETLIEKHQQKLSQLTEQTGSSSSQDEANNALLSQQKESLDSLASSITPSEQQKLDSLTARLAKLVVCEHEAHVTWFVAELYLRLQSD
ncbi:hypothetical protein CSKR_108647 [Clonorchis sinensis]|uniref:DNA-directed RNA polymerase III subunit RPC3 n=1 Tax=Clonorchis sinensis TaxID=79923 RepID=A0A8T1MMV7_CLOSI|nr:hypothetical protein CSKR_108647 [Clonorchis sinensis]